VDAVVIGGGIIGLSIARKLASHGLQVAVWDRSCFGTESSWAGAGMLAPGGEMDRRSWWGDLGLKSLAQYAEFVRELESDTGVRIDYRHCGALEVAKTDSEWTALLARAARQREWGIPVQEAGARQLFYPEDAAVNPRHLLQALRLDCERFGVRFREEQAVEKIAAEAGKIIKPEPASTAVLAAGAWSSSIPVHVDGSAIPVDRSYPIRGHLVAFAAENHTPGPILRHGHTYLLDRSTGATIAGSSTEQVGFLREPDPGHFSDIEERARTLMPDLQFRQRLDQWVGFRPGSESGEPQLGRLADTPVYLAYGHYRNGILLAPATADLIADDILGSTRASSQTDLSLQAVRR